MVEPFSRRRSRAIITKAPRFYLFDVGVAGHLTGRRIERTAGPDFGRALEHFVLMETLAYRSYRAHDFPVRFWRTKSGLECDFVLGREGGVAIEVKGGANPGSRELRGLRAFMDEHDPRGRRSWSATGVLPGERRTGSGSCRGSGFWSGCGGTES